MNNLKNLWENLESLHHEHKNLEHQEKTLLGKEEIAFLNRSAIITCLGF